MPDTLNHSPLENAHLALGARLIPFAGWNMPVQYSSILNEHAAVRQKAGVFDISHMGQLIVSGENATAWLNTLLTNNLEKLTPGQGQYTLLLNENGGVIDDLIAYRSSENQYLLVVNASMIAEDHAWLQKHLSPGVTLENQSDQWAGLAVQGPESPAIFAKLHPGQTLPPRNHIATLPTGETVCRTGYTGEDGYEIFTPTAKGTELFNNIIAAGATPCGLGARDTLRLEMAYPLNGNDLSPDRSPIEAGLGFFCDLTKPTFQGRQTLIDQKTSGPAYKLTAIRLPEKTPPPRPHYPVLTADGEVIGELSSGVLSPTLGHGIALAYLPAAHTKPGTPLLIDIRNRHIPATTTKKPFLKK